MHNELSRFEQRKQDHIDLALMPTNQASECNTFDTLTLVHEAIPDFNFEDISIETRRFNERCAKPFLVSSMTAGHQNAVAINQNLMAACDQSHWIMGVGSQRRELIDETAYSEWAHLKKTYPNVTLLSNVGLAQVIHTPLKSLLKLTDAIEAKALIIHCNPLQELIQPEGTPSFKGAWLALEMLVKQFPLPIVVKETGCGFSRKTLGRLQDIGVHVVDVAGLGGTHWGRIEGHRAKDKPLHQAAAQTFKSWGIDTLTTTRLAASLSPQYEIWGSGGVRHGLDAAKLFALGASTVGFAKPMLEPALTSAEAVLNVMNTIEYELKVAMFCTGSQTLAALLEAL